MANNEKKKVKTLTVNNSTNNNKGNEYLSLQIIEYVWLGHAKSPPLDIQNPPP